MKLYLKYFSMNVKSQMQHKLSFLFLFICQLLIAFSGLLAVYFLFARFSGVDGFSFGQILICFASVNMSFAFAEIFARGFDVFPRMLGDGRFDRILTRPRGIIFQVLAGQVEFHRLGRLIQSGLVLAYAVPVCGVIWRPDKTAVLCLMIICGFAVFFGLFLIHAGIAFFTLQQMEFMNVLTHGGHTFGRYPFSVYGEGVLKFLTYIIPLALFQYYPFMYLIGRGEEILFAVSPVIGLLFLLPAYGVFRFGLRHYKSTGS